MDRRLNRYLFLTAVLLSAVLTVSAQDDERPGDKDYKDKKQFERFGKRRAAIGAWQINQLRTGALVVRLKTNNLLISSLIKNGDTALAKEKQIETDGINLNTMKAYLNFYTFSKVYFMPSNFSDSLLNGVRRGIFLDTSLAIDPSIEMKESYYLVAERGLVYNSSIGFVPEDSAKLVKEAGYGVREMAVTVKNKYGHQLKRPFPYFSGDVTDLKIQTKYVEVIYLHGMALPFNISIRNPKKTSGNKRATDKDLASFNYKGDRITAFIPRYLTYNKLLLAVSNFNEELKAYYRKNAWVGEERINPEIKPFLY